MSSKDKLCLCGAANGGEWAEAKIGGIRFISHLQMKRTNDSHKSTGSTQNLIKQ